MHVAAGAAILVTGASGFLGRRFVESSLRAGYSTTGLSRRDRPPDLPSDMAWIQADLEQPDSLDALQPWRWDAVVHLAGNAAKGVPDWTEGARLITSHVRSTLNLVARIPVDRRCRFMLASGFIVYGLPEALPVREDHPRRPMHAYALAKVLTEDVVLSAMTLTDRWVLRLPGIFWEGRRSGALYGFAVAARTGAAAIVSAPGLTPWDVLHVDDAISAMLTGLRSCVVDPGPVNIGYGETIELAAVAARLFRLCGRSPEVQMEGVERHPPFQLDVSRMTELIGPLPATLDQRLLRVLDSIDNEASAEASV